MVAAKDSGKLVDWQTLDSEHYLHPFTDHKELGEKKSRIITRADGVYIWDAEGNRILDGMSGLWCVNAGYGRDELVDAATRQLKELPYYNSFFQCASPPSIELAAELSRITQAQFNRVFYAGSGSEAIDTVIRLVRRYWELAGAPERTHIIARRNAYHGSTIGGTSLGGMKLQRAQGGPLVPDIHHIDQPYWFGSDRDLSQEEFGRHAARLLEAKIDELGAERVAAFVAEPIQGAGGVIVPPDSYWPEVTRICRERDILLVTDEVICGFGRLGCWFGADYYETEPDLMTFAKGVTSGYLPLGGVMVSDRISDVLIDKGGEFFHGYTYSGHPACCAVALANIAIIEREGLIDYVRDDIGPYLQERWASLGEHDIVGETRMVGLMGALELVADKGSLERYDEDLHAGTICRDLSVENGLVMRAVGDTMVVAPPLTLNREQADELVDTAWKTLDMTRDALA
ncbi:MAG: aspartate aminotransferase family protein [Woeseiaceae bacterium]|nr:aspartate aminotransferase family protein [Woeseiaceae bacterium]